MKMNKGTKYKFFLVFSLFLTLLISYLLYSRHQDSMRLKEAIEGKDRIVALYNLTERWRYVQYVRKEGYVVIPDDLFILDKSGYSLDIKEELHLKIGHIKEDDKDFDLHFSTEIEGKTITATYVLDKDLKLLDSHYIGVNEQNVIADIMIAPAEEERLLKIVQEEIDGFLDKMYWSMYS